MVTYNLSLNSTNNLNINWAGASNISNNQASHTYANYDLRGIKGFYKFDPGFPASNDTVLLDKNSSGVFLAKAGNDKFDYNNSLGTQNTLLNGGKGEDTFAVGGLNVENALQALKDQGYSFIQYKNGFGLKTKDGQQIKAVNIEKIAFCDKTYDLRKPEEVKALVNALKCKGIPIINKTGRRQMSQHYCNCEAGLTAANNADNKTHTNYNLIPIQVDGDFFNFNNSGNTIDIGSNSKIYVLNNAQGDNNLYSSKNSLTALDFDSD